MPDPGVTPKAFAEWQHDLREELTGLLGIPDDGGRVKLDSVYRGSIERDRFVIEKWVYTAERGSRIPAVLYRPAAPQGLMPAVVLAYGHGASKSHPSYQYVAQLYAKLGIAVLAADPIGEEERHVSGKMGTRAHDDARAHRRANRAGRSIMGKLVFDTMRGVDFLHNRDDIDPNRIGVVGNSLGGALAAWMAALEPRLDFAVVSGWGYGSNFEKIGKQCTREPIFKMREQVSWRQFLALSAPQCDVLVLNGQADVVIDQNGNGAAWRDTQKVVDSSESIQAAFSQPFVITTWLVDGGGHRPYPAHPKGVSWLLSRARPAGIEVGEVSNLETINFGEWADLQAVQFEKLYGTKLHFRGATLVALDIHYLDPATLRVLTEDELGSPVFTLAGWLNVVD